MEEYTSHENYKYERSQIILLPFIKSPASNYTMIYTTLLEAVKQSRKANQLHTIITFDQPLFYKARDIVAACNKDTEISKNVFVRLGGFHLLMSFLGSIGHIMCGSGLKELLSLIYAPNATEKIFDGHAYARAVRAHSLAYLALI